MRIRRPAIYWRFLLAELSKLVLLSTAVVVAVGAFALAIKPLADGRLGSLDTLRFMMYASIPMLQYALPFAAGFAATLVYHRMAQDNELTACFAGGISHRVLLAPALLCGLVLGGALFLLADQAMPRLLKRMQELIAHDLTRLVAASIERGESISLDSTRSLYAEQFTRPSEPPPPPAYDHFILSGVLAVETDHRGNVVREASARHAYVWLYRGTEQNPGSQKSEPVTTVVMKLQDTVGGVANKGLFEVDQTPIVYRLPSTFSDDPKFLSWTELEESKRRPEMLNTIDQMRRELASRLAERLTADVVRTTLAGKSEVVLTDGAGRPLVLRAASLADKPDADGFALSGVGGGPIEVRTILEDGRSRVHRARAAWLSLQPNPLTSASQLNIKLAEVTTSGPSLSAAGASSASPASGLLKEYSVGGLTPAEDPLPGLLTLSVADLQSRAQQRLAQRADGMLALSSRQLARETDDRVREIISKQHERIAASIACVVTILAGAIMALRLKDSLPLPVYLWSFLPALGALFTISGGQSTASRQGSIGLLLLYSGIILLAGFTFVQYRRLSMR